MKDLKGAQQTVEDIVGREHLDRVPSNIIIFLWRAENPGPECEEIYEQTA